MGKRYTEFQKQINPEKNYDPETACSLLSAGNKCKFDETIDVAIRLGVDPKHADQMVRGVSQLPHGTGKKVRITVIAKGEKASDAKAAGAEVVGDKDVVAKIQEGWFDFDVLVVTPDMMAEVGKLGALLGPRGLMPNPKTGTVTMDIAKAVKDIKAGKIDFRVDKAGTIHTLIGKASFSKDQLKENLATVMEAIVKAKPSTAKGVYLKGITISTTMGPGIKVDPAHYL